MALTYRGREETGGNAGSWTSPAISIGSASSDRWVLVALLVNFDSATTVSIEVGGVSATLFGSLYTSGSLRIGLYKANVPTGTTAQVEVVLNGGVFETAVSVYTEDAGEPSLYDSATDASAPWAFSVDVGAAGDYCIGLVTGTGGSTGVTWSGLSSEDNDAFIGAGAFQRLSTASQTLSSAETGRSISATLDGSGYGFQEYGVVWSLSAPAGGGGPATITGTGAITTGATTVSGTAERSVTGTGAVTLAAATVAGTAERAITGAGALTTGAATVSGSGAVGAVVTGTGAITTDGVAVAGTGERAVTGTGAVATPAATVAGAAERQITGAGAVTLPAAQVAGTAERAVTGTGAINAPAATISGTGDVSDAGTVVGTGAIALAGATVAGTATRAITGAGAILVGAAEVAGTLNRSYDATGAIVLGAATVSGIATRSGDGDGRAATEAQSRNFVSVAAGKNSVTLAASKSTVAI